MVSFTHCSLFYIYLSILSSAKKRCYTLGWGRDTDSYVYSALPQDNQCLDLNVCVVYLVDKMLLKPNCIDLRSSESGENGIMTQGKHA